MRVLERARGVRGAGGAGVGEVSEGENAEVLGNEAGVMNIDFGTVKFFIWFATAFVFALMGHDPAFVAACVVIAFIEKRDTQ